MFASREPVPLVEAVLGWSTAGTERCPPLRAGVASGQALARGGTGTGGPVNLAARITGFAWPDSVVVDQGVKDALESANGRPVQFSFAGRRRFKGIRRGDRVHRVRRRGAESGSSVVTTRA